MATTSMAKAESMGLSEQDQVLFSDIREVLEKHGALEKFGITLLHEHFPIADDEILKEWHDVENRTLTLKPIKRGSIANNNLMYTAWELKNNTAAIMICIKTEFPGD